MNDTPYFPGFNPHGGRPRISHQERLKKKLLSLRKYRIDSYQNLFLGLLPSISHNRRKDNEKRRDRIYTREVTFCAFLSQIFNGNGSCREAVKLVQTWLHGDSFSKQISSNTAAYCKARLRLRLSWITEQFQHIADQAAAVPAEKLWHGRRVKIVDGTSFRLADTPENQSEWPQISGQKEGCGFPRVQVQGLICLASGALLNWVETAQTVHDYVAWQPLWKFFVPGDIILADRAYGAFHSFSILKQKQVDLVTRLKQSRKIRLKGARRLAKNDWLVTWKKPKTRTKGIPKDDWEQLDEEITVRIIRYTVKERGFRSKQITISTTLISKEEYPTHEIIDLYCKRWGIEVRFRDIKTTMQMDYIENQTPEMVRRTITMTAIAYNLIRYLINQAVKDDPSITYDRVSYAGTLCQIRQWLPIFDKDLSRGELKRLIQKFNLSLLDAPVVERPNRSEPRAKKYRGTTYRLLTEKRSEMIVERHRSKHKKVA